MAMKAATEAMEATEATAAMEESHQDMALSHLLTAHQHTIHQLAMAQARNGPSLTEHPLIMAATNNLMFLHSS